MDGEAEAPRRKGLAQHLTAGKGRARILIEAFNTCPYSPYHIPGHSKRFSQSHNSFAQGPASSGTGSPSFLKEETAGTGPLNRQQTSQERSDETGHEGERKGPG